MNLTVVRGDATAEEVAAVVTALSGRRPARVVSGYERWRRGRLRALGHTDVKERRRNG
jgi:hypothetical protein